MRRARSAFLGLGVGAILAACRAQDSAPPPERGRTGEELYQATCKACHAKDGRGTLLRLGPSFAGLRRHWDAQKLERYLLDPKVYAASDERLGERDMPALPADVSSEERALLVEFTLHLMD
jgi:mono/diheme cytochrome c family protein